MTNDAEMHGRGKGDSPTVLVVDDDPSVLTSLRRLIRTAGFQVKIFSRPSELLASEIPAGNACMVLDVNLPEMNGVQLHDLLRASGHDLPAVMITGRRDARTESLLRQAHPVAILFKPFDAAVLWAALAKAVAVSPQN